MLTWFISLLKISVRQITGEFYGIKPRGSAAWAAVAPAVEFLCSSHIWMAPPVGELETLSSLQAWMLFPYILPSYKLLTYRRRLFPPTRAGIGSSLPLPWAETAACCPHLSVTMPVHLSNTSVNGRPRRLFSEGLGFWQKPCCLIVWRSASPSRTYSGE